MISGNLGLKMGDVPRNEHGNWNQRTWCWFRSLGIQIQRGKMAGLRECFRSLVKNWDISHIYIYILYIYTVYIYILYLCMYIYIDIICISPHTIYIYSARLDEGVYLLTYWDEHPSNIVTTLTISLVASRSQSKRSMSPQTWGYHHFLAMRWERRACGGWNMSSEGQSVWGRSQISFVYHMYVCIYIYHIYICIHIYIYI